MNTKNIIFFIEGYTMFLSHQPYLLGVFYKQKMFEIGLRLKTIEVSNFMI